MRMKRLSKYQVSLLLLHLNQVSSDAIADQKLQLAALNAFDNNKKIINPYMQFDTQKLSKHGIHWKKQ